MWTKRPKDQDDDGANADSTPETFEALQRPLAGLSLSCEDTKEANSSSHSSEPTKPGLRQKQDSDKPDLTEKDNEDSKTYKINILRRDSDEVDSDSEEEEQESSSIKPDELLNVIFNFDTPREIDLKVKIKGDFNVTILA
ncbi:uncharacterized protein BDV17DRAFT_267348 [Aspergillus undulatus]|uniref:uncharacterized protein n=1 Tax=Aspergillus undulatus TaxID=1810928 RepID=UPI003CCD82F1